MSQGFGHPPLRDQRLPRMNDILAPTLPITRPRPVSPLLPPPNKAPRPSHYVGTQSLTQYRSQSAGERVTHGQQQDVLYPRSIVESPLSCHVHDRGQSNFGTSLEHRISYPLYSYSHSPTHRQESRPMHATYPPVAPVASFAINGETGLRLTHSSHDQKVPGDVASSTPMEQLSPLKQATAISTDSPWGLTKAGKARKRLEQACVSCRKKKTKCEPVSSSSKCLPCEKNGIECHFDCA